MVILPQRLIKQNKLICSMEIKKRLDQVATIAYSNHATIYNTYELALQANHLDGCFVECGVGAGAQLMAMALTYTKKDIIAFDSFEGIPLACEHDDSQPGIGSFTPVKNRLVSSGITVHSVENVLSNFEMMKVSASNLKLIRGWFQNTLPKFQPVPIALLRLDGDLYESTKVCLEYLYPMVTIGGIVIIDDWALGGCQKAVREYFGHHLPEIIEVPGTQTVVYFYKK